MKYLCCILLAITAATRAAGQPSPEAQGAGSTSRAQDARSAPSRDALKVNDELIIAARDVEGMADRPYRIDSDGTITVPLAGKVRAEGFTLEEFKKELEAQLGVYVRSPKVSVRRVAAARANTFVATGAFKTPGVYPLSDRRSVLEVISAAGGLQPNAAPRVKITRRLDGTSQPIPSAVTDPAAGTSVATVNLTRLMENPGLGENVLIEPGDILSAEPAVVFLTGEVQKPGSYELTEREAFTLTELISLGGGLTRDAAPQKVKILRPILNGSRRAEIAVDAKSILGGQAEDFRILANDVVVVPRSGGALRTAGKVAMYMVPALVTTLIYLAVR